MEPFELERHQTFARGVVGWSDSRRVLYPSKDIRFCDGCEPSLPIRARPLHQTCTRGIGSSIGFLDVIASWATLGGI